METYKIHIHVAMTTGHEFDDYFDWKGKPTIDDMEKAMNIKAKMRGFRGIEDIENFDVIWSKR